MSRYVGVDLHTNSSTACYLEGSEMSFKSYKLTMAGPKCFKQSLRASDELAVKTTGNTDYFAEAVKDQVSRTVVVNTRQFGVIRKSVSKTDKNDAKALAYFLSKDMLPSCRRKGKAYQQVASLSQTRDKLVKTRTFFMNKIHGLLNGYGIKLKKESLGSKKGLSKILTYQVDEVTRFELELLVTQIRSLKEAIKKADEKLVELGSKLPGHENLSSIKGIGARSATVLLSVIGDINDFADESKLAAYFGIVPRVSNSNDTEHHGRITKRGSKLGRTTLVAIRYSDYLRKFYDRIKAKRGSGKAIIATAKKMLGIIYNTLVNNWIFEDFTNFVLAN